MVLYLVCLLQMCFANGIADDCYRQQVEMHVAILAACLPTLKPLFASFFGQIRTFTRGRTTSPNTPNRGSGYVRQENEDFFTLKNLSEGAQSSSQYYENVVLGKEPNDLQDYRTRRISNVRDIDENMLEHGKRGSTRITIVSTAQASMM